MAATLTPAPTQSRAVDQRRLLALICVATAQLMIALDATIMNIALPSVQTALRFSDADRQWIIASYTLAFGGLLLAGGRAADSASIGRRRAFLIGLIGFAAASAASGAASSFGVLVAARAAQGAFAALLAPTALSLVAVMFTEPHERAKAFGVYGAIAASGGAMGLLLGGALTQYLDWRWCLYVNVPIALLAALGGSAVLRNVPAPAGPSRTESFDILGLVLASSGLVGLVYACGRATTQSVPVFAAGVVALAAFVWHEAHTPSPLLPLHVVLDRQRGPAYLCALLAIGGMFGAFLSLTYELQVVLGFSPLLAGVAFLPMSAATFVVATVVTPRLLPRFSPGVLMVPGFVIAGGGMLLLSRLQITATYIKDILPAEIMLGLGLACVMVAAASAATSGVNQRDAGIASAVLNSAQQIGASLGTAVLNSVAASSTVAFLVAGAGRPEALVHGYATAAAWGAALLLIGAFVASRGGTSPAGISAHAARRAGS
jgi:EmrB/QacA subfamily drug resistance transporter